MDLTAHTNLSPIRRGFAPSFVNYKIGCTRLAAASDKFYQLLAQGRWFSPGIPASSTTKTGRHDIAEILMKVALNTKNSNSNSYSEERLIVYFFFFNYKFDYSPIKLFSYWIRKKVWSQREKDKQIYQQTMQTSLKSRGTPEGRVRSCSSRDICREFMCIVPFSSIFTFCCGRRFHSSIRRQPPTSSWSLTNIMTYIYIKYISAIAGMEFTSLVII